MDNLRQTEEKQCRINQASGSDLHQSSHENLLFLRPIWPPKAQKHGYELD